MARAGWGAVLRRARAPIGRLLYEIDRLFDDTAPGRSIFNFGTGAFALVPALELVSGEEDYRLTAELPGIKESDVEISVAEGVLTLRGEKRADAEHKEEGLLVRERRYGSFARSVTLPSDVDADAISAAFAQGVLTITLPKDDNATGRARKIAISSKG